MLQAWQGIPCRPLPLLPPASEAQVGMACYAQTGVTSKLRVSSVCTCSRGIVAVRVLHETLQLHQATADMVHSQPLQALLSLADAAALSADSAASVAPAASNVLSGATADGTVDAAAQTAQRAGGWFGFISDGLETVLDYIQSGLQQLHVPYTYGWSIILLTCIVKLALLPVTKIQVGASSAPGKQACHC